MSTPIKSVEDFIHDNFTGDQYYGTADMVRELVREQLSEAAKGSLVIVETARSMLKEQERALRRAFDEMGAIKAACMFDPATGETVTALSSRDIEIIFHVAVGTQAMIDVVLKKSGAAA